jgi:hypothetical protein
MEREREREREREYAVRCERLVEVNNNVCIER